MKLKYKKYKITKKLAKHRGWKRTLVIKAIEKMSLISYKFNIQIIQQSLLRNRKEGKLELANDLTLRYIFKKN